MSKYIMFRWKMFVHLLMMSMRAASFIEQGKTGNRPLFYPVLSLLLKI